MAPPEQSPQNQVGREAIHLVAYDARWPAAYEAEHQRLLSLFPLQLRAVEHIGSTAVPGMPAKPIVDVLAGVDSMAVADGMFEPVLSNGYSTSRAFNEMLPGRRWFMRPSNGQVGSLGHLERSLDRTGPIRIAARRAVEGLRGHAGSRRRPARQGRRRRSRLEVS